MPLRSEVSSPLALQTGGGALLTFAPTSVAPGAAAGASAGQLLSPLFGAVFSVLGGNAVVSSSTGALRTSTTAPTAGAISAHVRVQDATNSSAEELTISIPVAAIAPSVTTSPSLSTSSPMVGRAITATPGVYAGTPAPTITRQWFYADTGAAITGATSLSYTPVSADVGHPLKYIETATNTAGSVAAAAPVTAAVVASGPGPSPAPSFAAGFGFALSGAF